MLAFRGDQQSGGLLLRRVHTHNYNLHFVLVCACACVHGVGWARTRILSRPTVRIHSVLYYSNTGPRLVHIREMIPERTPTVSKPLFSPQTNITSREILLYYIFVKMLKRTPPTTEVKVHRLCVNAFACVFGYRARVMCGL